MSAVSTSPAEPLLFIAGLRKSYQGRPVLRDVSLSLETGRTLAIIGRSGSGKTTLARCLAGFESPDGGEIRLRGRDLRAQPRTAVQLIFQQPAASLSPRFTAAEIVGEPMLIQRRGDAAQRREAVRKAMEAVGLDPACAFKPALSFSGGERQRLAIARALAADSQVLILDESLAGLDLSLAAQIANLLLDLQERRGIGYILISHDLSTAARIAHEVAVLDEGCIVEHGPADDLLSNPRHPAARRLLAARSVASGAP